MEIKNVTITKRDGSKDRFSLDKIMSAICKAFESVNEPTDLGTVSKILSHLDVKDNTQVEDIQSQVEAALMREGHYNVAKSFILYRHDRRHYNTGRPSVTQLCRRLTDNEWIYAFREAQERASIYIDNPNQYVCVFFTTLFSLLGNEVPSGKIAYYWKMLRKHIVGLKIPALRTIQYNIERFMKWKDNAIKWGLSKAEKIKFKAWSALQNVLEKLLPNIEPKLVTVAY